MKDIVFISFDIPRADYPAMTYSMASIFATLKANGYKCSHFPIDVKQAMQDGFSGEKLTSIVKSKLSGGLEFFKGFRYIAISVTRWSVEHSNSLIDMLDGYEGKIILGGYEITATDNEILLKEYPKADYFIKGYAERALVKLLKNEYPTDKKIILESISEEDLASPYLTGVLNLYTRKIYWETKRGCKFRCGFCEWGNAEKILIELDKTRLFKEIDLIKDSSIEEINILDATFNFGRNYLEILHYLLEQTDLKITFQARFETLIGKQGEEFLELSAAYKERIHMEFGLQTIHQEEMDVIGRKNDLDKIEIALKKLNLLGISYEVSIIYAIPGQTVERFIDTIEFLLINHCKIIRAYPLQIPRNSELETKRGVYQITEVIDNMNVHSIQSSFSFQKENRTDMDSIALRLNTNELQSLRTLPNESVLKSITLYQFEITSIDSIDDKKYLCDLIENSYVRNSMNDIQSIDFFGSLMILGQQIENIKLIQNTGEYLRRIHNQTYFFSVTKKESSELSILNVKIKQSTKDIKYLCKIRVGKSGNFYVYREIVSSN